MNKLLAILLVFGLVLSGCAGMGTTSIKEINENPMEFTGKEITVHGTATGAVVKDSGDIHFYLVDGEGNKLLVQSMAMPREGQELTIHGIVTLDPLTETYYLELTGWAMQ